MATTPDDLLARLDRVTRLAQAAVDQYDICQAKPDDQRESDRLFSAIRDLRKALDETKKSP